MKLKYNMPRKILEQYTSIMENNAQDIGQPSSCLKFGLGLTSLSVNNNIVSESGLEL